MDIFLFFDREKILVKKMKFDLKLLLIFLLITAISSYSPNFFKQIEKNKDKIPDDDDISPNGHSMGNSGDHTADRHVDDFDVDNGSGKIIVICFIFL